MGEVSPGMPLPYNSKETLAKLRRLIVVPVLAAALLVPVSCGSDSSSQAGTTQEIPHNSAHQAPPEIEQKILADAREDLAIIASAGADTSTLSNALTGSALTDTKAQTDKDLAEGKYRKRDYQNINVRLQDYAAPIAEVFAEFDDNGYYVDAVTGAALGQPVNEHKSYALALVEEGNRWKIRLILAPSAASTAKQTGQ